MPERRKIYNSKSSKIIKPAHSSVRAESLKCAMAFMQM